jgi:thiol-disulfide isomerase/thioredoxin
MSIGNLKTREELQYVLAQMANRVICIKFTAKWCGPCKKIQPLLDSLAANHTDIGVYTSDVDESQELVGHFKIISMPTFIFIRDNKIITIIKGADESVLQNTFNVISGMNGTMH